VAQLNSLPDEPGGGVKVGLVFAGGGAKGGYQVGVVQALAAAGLAISSVAGASIGALNGAVVAASRDLPSAAVRLEALWMGVARDVDSSIEALRQRSRELGRFDQPSDLRRIFELIRSPILSDGFLDSLMRQTVAEDELRNGLPLWVSVYPPGRAELTGVPYGWMFDFIETRLRAQEGTWIHVNDRDGDRLFDTVLASAALPLAFPPRQVEGRKLRDGGITDNIPAAPLARYEGCDVIVVVHLTGGEMWVASDFEPAKVIEIRPEGSLNPTGNGDSAGLVRWVIGLLDFSTGRFEELMERGRRDAERAIGLLTEILHSAVSLRSSSEQMLKSLEKLDDT